jgi:hypothetical protein
LAKDVDTRLLQRLTVAEFFGLMGQFGGRRRDRRLAPAWVRRRGLKAFRRALDEISNDYEVDDATKMRADAQLPLPALPSAASGASTTSC